MVLWAAKCNPYRIPALVAEAPKNRSALRNLLRSSFLYLMEDQDAGKRDRATRIVMADLCRLLQQCLSEDTSDSTLSRPSRLHLLHSLSILLTCAF